MSVEEEEEWELAVRWSKQKQKRLMELQSTVEYLNDNHSNLLFSDVDEMIVGLYAQNMTSSLPARRHPLIGYNF